MSATSDKLFEFTREVNHYCELEPDSELAKIKVVVPSYILVGDQSSGKTSLLSRLARLPLGYTANKTGTRRPVEYNLIHDDSKLEPEIEVNSKKVEVADFLKVMIKENGAEGFNDSAVSVKILWKNIPESVIVADMPGMKDGDTEPENMILRRLRNSNVIPVVILEPKDFDSKHFAFDLLKRANRRYEDIIAVVNKCDEKMAEKGQWSNQTDWCDFWETAKKKGFKNICITGWPCSSSDRNSPDLDKQRKVLGDSCKQEENLIMEWCRRVDVCPEAAQCIGLDKFRKMLHTDQSKRLDELCHKSLPYIRSQREELGQKLLALRNMSKESLRAKISERMHSWACKASDLLEGKADLHHLKQWSSTAEKDFEWLFGEGQKQFDMLKGLDDEYNGSTATLLKGEGNFFTIFENGVELGGVDKWTNLIQHSVFGTRQNLLGKAALQRILDIAFTTALCRIFQHALTEFDTAFIENILAEYSQDTGNKVIQQFVKRVLDNSLQPLVNVLSLLIWKHLEICFTASNKVKCKERILQDLKLEEHFDRCAKDYARKLVEEFIRDVRERLQEQGELLQGRRRNGESNLALGSNFAGNTLANDPLYADLAGESFGSTASRFLTMGIEVLGKTGKKLQQGINLYEILLTSAETLQGESVEERKIDAQNMFPLGSGKDARDHGEVQKLRSRPIPSSGNITVRLSASAGRWDQKGEEINLNNQRSDESMVMVKGEAPLLIVALNDFTENKWLISKGVPKGLAGREEKGVEFEVTFKMGDLQNLPANRFVTIDVIFRKCNVSVKEVRIGKKSEGNEEGEEEEEDFSSTSSQPEATELPQDIDQGDASSVSQDQVQPAAHEAMAALVKLGDHMKSTFQPLPGSKHGGMDYRKLLADASCELVEQVISFRELFERRLERLRLTAQRDLSQKVSNAPETETVVDTLSKGNRKKIKKTEKLEKVLEKALDLHRQSKARGDSDSESDTN